MIRDMRSVESRWLAVDAKGHLGLFEAAREALVPADAWPDDVFALHALCAGRALVRGARRPAAWPPALGSRALVVIDPARAADRAYRSGSAPSRFEQSVGERAFVVHEHAPRIVASLEPLGDAQLAALASDPTITLVLGERSLARFVVRGEWEGLFRYASTGDGTYRRVCVPERPVKVGELPWPECRELAVPRTAARFSREVQLVAQDALPRATFLDAAAMARRNERVWLGLGLERHTHGRLGAALGLAAGVHALLWLLMR